MIRVFCDRCNTEVTRSVIQAGRFSLDVQVTAEGTQQHLCPPCVRELLATSLKYPDTKFLTLCTLKGRRGGEVTVGESRLPVVGVLRTIRAVGAAEAEGMWPQLTAEELGVLERLVMDLDTDAAGSGEDDD